MLARRHGPGRYSRNVEMLDVLLIAVTVLAYAIISEQLANWWITMPMVFVTAGAVFDATDAINLSLAIDVAAILAEVTLAIILFSDAVRMDIGRLRPNAGIPTRLLLIALPLSIVLGTMMNWLLLPGISLAAAGLIASVLAPTDAALGEAIVSEPTVPERIRDSLNVEAGLNDGLAVPAVLLFIDLTMGELDGGSAWARFLLRQIGGGVATGIIIGAGSAWLIGKARALGWTEALHGQIATLAVAVVTFAAAGELGVNEFIAAFVAGLAFGAVLDDSVAEHLDEYTTDTGVLLASISFFVFGNLFVVPAFESLSWQVALCAVGALTIGRMIPVAIATIGVGLATPTVAFLGWFGPRGLASIVFGILLLEEELEVGPQLFDVIALVVLASVFLHGLSATPGARRYGQWYTSMAPVEPDMPESVEVEVKRLRM